MITATPQPAKGRIVVTITNPPPDPVIERNTGTGWRAIRVGRIIDRQDLQASIDFEAPVDTPVRYRVEGQEAATPPVTLPSNSRVWWTPLPYPSLATPVDPVDLFNDKEWVTDTHHQWPTDTPWPVTITGQRRAWNSKLVLATSGAAAAKVRDGVRTSPIALVRATGIHEYVALGQVVEQRWGGVRWSPATLWQIKVQQIKAPVLEWGIHLGATWGDWRDSGATWGTWRSGTWIDVLTGATLPGSRK